jgi:glucose dehydrogenase
MGRRLDGVSPHLGMLIDVDSALFFFSPSNGLTILMVLPAMKEIPLFMASLIRELNLSPVSRSSGTALIVMLYLALNMTITILVGADRLENYRDWGVYRGDKKGNQFAELSQINAANVTRLKPLWEYHTGDAGARTSSYVNPIMVDGIVYVSTPSLNAAAIDAETGEEIWFFDSSKYNESGRRLRGRNRGVVYWEGEASSRIFVFVRHRVYAVDAKTGELIEDFGSGGFIDLRFDLDVDPATASVETTCPGIVFEDKLIVTARIPEGYISTPGHIRAYNAITGEFEWVFHTIPHAGEFGYDTWEFVKGEQYGGGLIPGADSRSMRNVGGSSVRRVRLPLIFMAASEKE